MEDNRVGQLGRAIRQATRSGVETRRRVLIARAKSLLKGHRLPPGNFFQLEPLLASDPKALALKAAKTGPILTGIWGDKVAIFVTSLSVARRLLQKHRDDLNATSIDITSVVPKGIIRTMEGVDHKTYRKHFSLAIAPTAFSPQEARSIVEEGLAKANADGRPDNAICEQIALRMLLLTFVGITRQSPIHQELEDQFNAMAPNGFAWRVGPRQKAAFEILRSRLVALASVKEDALDPDSVLYRLAENDATDLTTIGNLIYMIEMGRFDISTFLFRIANFLGEDLSLFKRIVAGEKSDLGVSIAQAIPLEVLRLEQSERLMRSAKRDFVFDGFLFPKGAVVRICLWEAHKDSDAFENPFSFDPERHFNTSFSGDQFCPFGMGHHQCPAADASAQLATLFIEVYAKFRLGSQGRKPGSVSA